MQARDLLNLGIRWIVGDGTSIRAWGDPWLSEDDEFYVHTIVIQGLEDFTINGLINENDSTWNASLICELLIPSDVIQITKIPLMALL